MNRLQQVQEHYLYINAFCKVLLCEVTYSAIYTFLSGRAFPGVQTHDLCDAHVFVHQIQYPLP